MGKLADLLNPISAATTAASGLAGTIGSWLGIGQKRQVEQQKELQEHAAETNYKYGEKSAENAFERQMKAYEQTYSDNTLQNQVNQAKDAGLSIGMLYGGGAQGGGEGSLGGGTQGTGAAGVGAGQAPAAGLEMQGLALMQQGLRSAAEIDLIKSQKDLNEAKADEAKGIGKKAEEDAETARQIRQYMVEGRRQEAISIFIQNCKEEWKSSGLYGDEENEEISYNNAALLFDYTIAQGSYNIEMMTATLDNLLADTKRLDELMKLAKEQAETEEQKQLLTAAQTALTNEQTKYYWKVVQSEYLKALASVQDSKTRIKELDLSITKAKAETIFKSYIQKNENLRTAVKQIEVAINSMLGTEKDIVSIISSIINSLGTTAVMSMLI